ncbi:MAG: competence protein ComEC family protein [Oscillospiraceae bacterium]|nr:competence protein ComEC family protein [Oscillospiraceae bacterium]
MKLKAAVVGFSYLAGLIAAFQLGLSPLQSLFALIAGILGGIVFILLKHSGIGAVLIVFAAAFGVYGFYRATAIEPVHRIAAEGEILYVEGKVIDKTAPARDMAGYTVEAVIDGVTARFSLYAPDTGAEVGDKLSFDAAFSLLRDNTAFAEASYYMSRGIFLRATAKTAPIAESSENFSIFEPIRNYNRHLKQQIMTAFPNDTGGLICAVFLGDKSALSPALSSSITRAGASHYTSVSGLHLTLISHLFMSLLGLTRLKVMRKTKFILFTLLSLAFVVFFNMSPSVMRAGAMLIVFYGGELFMRRGNTLNSIGFAALVILIISPYAALDAGLLLSIAGTIGIGVIAPAVNAHLDSGGFTKLKKLREVFTANLCASLATLPLVAIFFGGASLISPVTSVILLPFFFILVTAMVFFALTAGLLAAPLFIAGVTARVIVVVVGFFGGFKFAHIPLQYGFIAAWIVLAAAFIGVTLLYYKKVAQVINAVVISIFTLAMMIIATEYLHLEQTRLQIYSDGTSACVFLRYKNSSVAIITDDGIRAAHATRDFIFDNFLDEISLLILLNSTNNSLPFFAEIPAIFFISPHDENADGFYDVGGIFTVMHNPENSSALVTYNDLEISVSHVRNSSDSDINITYSFSVNPGEFGGLVINTARRQEALSPHQLNAFYTKIDMVLD